MLDPAGGNHPTQAQEAGLKRALIAGIVANFGVAVIKFVAFWFTRSTAMLAESIHSVADSSNQALLFVGLKRSQRPASEAHPFGYTVERYFWTFVVAINIFVLGAVFAIYEGIHKIRAPHPIDDPSWNYIALGLGAIFEFFALRIAWKEFQHWRGSATGPIWSQLRRAKDLSLPTVLFEDTAALLGLTIAAIGIGLAQLTHNGIYDGIASVLIGVVLLAVAWFLATESHSLLIGEAASRIDRTAIQEVVDGEEAVDQLVELTTLQRGPSNILVALVLEFRDELQVPDVERAVQRIEISIRDRVPAARNIFIEAGAFRRGPRKRI